MDTPRAYDEMCNSSLPDKRRRRTAARVLEAVIEHQDASLSAACGPGLRQAAGDLFAHSTTSVDALLSGHIEQTNGRVAEFVGDGLLLVVQDTTFLDFAGHTATTGLGYFNRTRGRGLVAHSALAITSEGMPLGVLELNVFARNIKQAGKSKARHTRPIKEKESFRWQATLHKIEERLPEYQAVLVMADREADIGSYLLALRRPNTHLLVRASQPRNVRLDDTSEPGSLMELVASCPVVCQMQVDVSRARDRLARHATMDVQFVRALLGKEKKPVYIVRTFEVGAPEDQEPLEWVLISTMPVLIPDDAVQLARFYSKRWVIERLHYVLKTGCGAERLQLDDAHSLANGIALYYVKAWWLLFLTHLAREKPDTSVEAVLKPAEIAVLILQTQQPIKTVAQAVIAIARLAGYAAYPSSPPPGPKTIWMGLSRLEAMTVGYELAMQLRDNQ
jgi:Transposase DDE domain